MGKYVIDETTLTAIGNSIRTKEGTTGAVPVIEMAERIAQLKDMHEVQLVSRSLTAYENDAVTQVGAYAFYHYYELTGVNLPECTQVGSHAFQESARLADVELPKCTKLEGYAFQDCSLLENISLPECTSIGTYAFRDCANLKSVILPKCKTISANAFRGCTALEVIDFSQCTSVPTLASTTVFTSVPSTCQFKVPAALESEWKAASNWSSFAGQIVGV